MTQQSYYTIHNKIGGLFMLRKLQTVTLELMTLFFHNAILNTKF